MSFQKGLKIGLVSSKPSTTNPNGKLYTITGLNLNTSATFNLILSNVCVTGTPGEQVKVGDDIRTIKSVKFDNGTNFYELDNGQVVQQIEPLTPKSNPQEGDVYFFYEKNDYAKVVKKFRYSKAKELLEKALTSPLTQEELSELKAEAFLASGEMSFVAENDKVVFESGKTAPLYQIVSVIEKAR